MQFSPTSSAPQYKIFRYFSYGTRDLTFTIAPVNTSVYVLANSQPVRSQTLQPTTYEAA